MINIYDICKDNNIVIRKIKKKDNYTIIYSNDNNYLIKEKNIDKKSLYNLFEKLDYSFYIPLIDDNELYELSYYYEDNISNIEKKKELIKALYLLHSKTENIVDINDEDINNIYNELKENINNIKNYYLDLQDYIEGFSFPRLDYYFLIINISMFYKILDYAEYNLEEWKKIALKRIRKSMCISKVTLDNFTGSYFIDWDYVKDDNYIHDLVSLYKNIDESLIDNYIEERSIEDDEKFLFYTYICIPEVVNFTNNIYDNFLRIKKIINYIEKTNLFLSKEYEKDKKTDEDKFKE